MNQQEVAAVVKGISLAVFAQVNRALGDFSQRMAALEQRMASVTDGAQGPAGERGETGAVGPAGADGAAGAPGRDADESRVLALEAELKSLRDDLTLRKDAPTIAGLFIDREGQLVVTMSDGTVKACGVVVGRDGRDVDLKDVEVLIAEAVERLPRPKDGRDGKDGSDGLGFDDFELVPADETRGYQMRFARGDQVKDFPVGIPHYRGVYVRGTTYPLGACTTFANSGWIAIRETSEVPGDGPNTGWRMLARGIQGKTGPKGDKGDRGVSGPEGPPGPARW